MALDEVLPSGYLCTVLPILHLNGYKIASPTVVPRRRYPAVKVMAPEGIPVEVACRVLDVSTSGHYEQLTRPLSARAVRHAWLTGLITEIHQQFRQGPGFSG